MTLSGLTNKEGNDRATQIKATQELGWKCLSGRSIGDSNIHDLPQTSFQKIAEDLAAAKIQVLEFGSLIGSWSKNINSDFNLTLAEIERAIPLMQQLETKIVRVMSYGQNPWGEDRQEAERFRRLREIVARFADAGITAAHENCVNWGGFSKEHTLGLFDKVPGLKLMKSRFSARPLNTRALPMTRPA